MNGIGPQGAGYTGIGVTGQDVLIYGNLLVTGAIDPTSLSFSPTSGGPTGSIWYDNNNFVRLDQLAVVDRLTGTFSSTIQNNQIQISGPTGATGATSTSSVYLDVLTAGTGSIYVAGTDPLNRTGEINIKGQYPPYLDVKYTDAATNFYTTTLFHNYIDYNGGPTGADPFKFYHSGTTEMFNYDSNKIQVALGKRVVLYDGNSTSTSSTLDGSTQSIINVNDYQSTNTATSMRIGTGIGTANLTLYGGYGGVGGTPGAGGTIIKSGTDALEIDTQIKLPTTTGTISLTTTGVSIFPDTIVINCNNCSTGIFYQQLNNNNNINYLHISNARNGGQYVVYLSLSGGAASIQTTLTPLTGNVNATNYTSPVNINSVGGPYYAIMTITTYTIGLTPTFFISCSAYQ